MTFNMKLKQENTGGNGSEASADDWAAWNDYKWSLIKGAEKPATRADGSTVDGKITKTANAIGILNAIVDVGFQKQRDAEYDSKLPAPAIGDDVMTEEEAAHVKQFPDNYFKWDGAKRKQCRPMNPVQEFAFLYDFPEIMVDFGKHPLEHVQELGLKPLRVSYNGMFKRDQMIVFGKNIAFEENYKTKRISPKCPLNKIAMASYKDGVSDLATVFQEGGYDISALVQSAARFDIVASKQVTSDNKTFYNTDLKNVSAVLEQSLGGQTFTIESQIPKLDVPFTGVMLNNDGQKYTDVQLGLIKAHKEIKAVVERATSFYFNQEKWPDWVIGADYADSDLAKALAKTESSAPSSKPVATGNAPKEDKLDTMPTNASAPQDSLPLEDGIDFDDDLDVPF